MDNKKYNFFCFTLNTQKESTNPTQELMHLQDILLSKYNSFLATIIHDKDILENKEPKRIHAHVFIKSNAKLTCKQQLTQLVELLNINANQIQIQGTNNQYLQVQYLVHKNDLDKYQYNFTDIKTNDQKLLIELFDKIYKSPQELKDQSQRDILECKTIVELMSKQGLDFANKYRTTFNQIKQEQKLDFPTLMSYIETYERLIERLKLVLTDNTRLDGFIEARLIDNLLHSIDFKK